MKFLELKEGPNLIRALTFPYQYYAHGKYIPVNSLSFDQKLKCPITFDVIVPCELCNNGDVPCVRWVMGVLSRADNEYYLLDFDSKIFSQFRYLVQNENYGDPKSYDVQINIEVDYDNFSVNHNPYIIPMPKSDLTSEELGLINSENEAELTRITNPVQSLELYKTVFSTYNLNQGSSD